MMRKDRAWRYVYTPKKYRRRAAVRIALFIIALPIVIPLYALFFVGWLSQITLDFLDDVSESISEFIVFKILRR
jgi:hypothetical protein